MARNPKVRKISYVIFNGALHFTNSNYLFISFRNVEAYQSSYGNTDFAN